MLWCCIHAGNTGCFVTSSSLPWKRAVAQAKMVEMSTVWKRDFIYGIEIVTYQLFEGQDKHARCCICALSFFVVLAVLPIVSSFVAANSEYYNGTRECCFISYDSLYDLRQWYSSQYQWIRWKEPWCYVEFHRERSMIREWEKEWSTIFNWRKLYQFYPWLFWLLWSTMDKNFCMRLYTRVLVLVYWRNAWCVSVCVRARASWLLVLK